MRVTSALWVGAFLRRHQADGRIAVVERRGAEEAGAIFVTVDRLDGTVDLYAPASQTAFAEGHPSDRRFQKVAAAEPREAVAARLEREKGFDPDVWIVTVESRDGRVDLDLA